MPWFQDRPRQLQVGDHDQVERPRFRAVQGDVVELDRKVGDLSTGNKQKVGVVQALMHRSELLLLNEPTSGLDPLMQQEFNTLIDETRASGRTVFLSSHVLPEVERLADRVGIVRQSRLVALEDVGALKEKALRHVELTFPARVDPNLFQRLNDGRVAWI